MPFWSSNKPCTSCFIALFASPPHLPQLSATSHIPFNSLPIFYSSFLFTAPFRPTAAALLLGQIAKNKKHHNNSQITVARIHYFCTTATASSSSTGTYRHPLGWTNEKYLWPKTHSIHALAFANNFTRPSDDSEPTSHPASASNETVCISSYLLLCLANCGWSHVNEWMPACCS